MNWYRYTRTLGDSRDGLGSLCETVFEERDDIDARTHAARLDVNFMELGGFVTARKLERGKMVSVRKKEFQRTKKVLIEPRFSRVPRQES